VGVQMRHTIAAFCLAFIAASCSTQSFEDATDSVDKSVLQQTMLQHPPPKTREEPVVGPVAKGPVAKEPVVEEPVEVPIEAPLPPPPPQPVQPAPEPEPEPVKQFRLVPD